MKSEQQYIDLFTANRDLLDRNGAAVMNACREKAFADFARLGFPTQKMERYKYTDVEAAFAPDYGVNLSRLEFAVNPYEAFRCDVPNLSTSLYFMVNDAFGQKSLPAAALPEGVAVCSLRQAAEAFPAQVAECYARLARTEKDSINALNTMLVQDGLFVYVPKGVAVERTIQIVNLLRADVDLMVNRRVLVVLEDGAQARLLFCDHAMDDRDFLTTQVVEVFAGENSNLELYELEETHVKNHRFSNMYVDLQRGSAVSLYNFTLHNGLTRNRTDVTLSGEGAEVGLYGGVIADKEQRVDNNTLIDHRAGHCTSRQLYKYVMDGRSVGAFAGRVLVRHGAQHTVSEERNANLCATSEARMYAQPMLEIYADDVKCSHGATTGQLDESAMFYMRQRGISEDEARLLLMSAFVNDVVENIRIDALKDKIHLLVDKRLRGEKAKCQSCSACK